MATYTSYCQALFNTIYYELGRNEVVYLLGYPVERPTGAAAANFLSQTERAYNL